MPRKRWTTTDQLDWLQPWIPAFTKAQESKEFNSFFVEMYDAWFKKYPLDRLKAQEIGEKIKGLEDAEAAGNTERAEKIREAWWQLRLHNWFNNNTRAGSSADDKRGILKVTKPRQAANWQTYLTMYYDKLKPEIDEAFETYTASLKPDQTPKKRVSFQAEFTKQKYMSEKEEVQKKVEEYRKEWRDRKNGGYKSMEPNEIQAGINSLPRTLRAYAQALAEQTGWSFTILAGGPNPRHGGKITTYNCHVGSIPGSDLEFDAFLGSEEWGNSVIAKWDTFLHQVYSEDVRAQFASSNEGTPAPTEGSSALIEKTPTPMEETEDEEEKGGNKKMLGKSQDLFQKNSELLAPFFEALEELSEGEPVTKINKKEVKKKTKAGKGKGKGKASTIKDKPITRSVASSHNDALAPPLPTSSLEGIQITKQTGAQTVECDREEIEDGNGNEEPAGSSSVETSNKSDAPSGKSDVETGEKAASESTTMTVDSTRNAVSTNPINNTVSIDEAAPECDGTNDSVENDVMMKDTTSILSPAPNAESIDKAVPDDAGDISVKDVEMKDLTANETQLKSADDLTIANQDLEVDLFLHGITDQLKWRELVSKWQAFENDYPIKGNLPTAGRPEEVAWWLKRGRKYKVIPTIKRRFEYMMAWRSWWNGMQPDGRKSDAEAWPLPRMDLTSADWMSVARAGPTGLLLVVVSLAWWGHHVQGEGQMEEFLVAVDDVSWALTQITSLPPPPQSLPAPESVRSGRNTKPKSKREADPEFDEHKNKKPRVE